jgi:UDP-glucose 4-epimerase
LNGKVLVTGGAGFIGSHVVDRFVNEGYRVNVIDNLSTGNLANISKHINCGIVNFAKADIRDRDAISKSARNVDAVVHLAAIVSVQFSMGKPGLTHKVNVEGTRNLLKSCISNGVNKIIFISSSSVYGAPRYLPIDEKHPTNPISPYASSKLEGECLCQEFANRSDRESAVLRLFNVYGPRQTPNEYSGVITKFIEQTEKNEPLVIYGNGSQTRDFVHVTDVATAIVTLVKDDWEGEIFNIGYGTAVSINDLAKIVMRLACRNCGVVYEPAKSGDILHSVADISKAKKTFRYTPEICLEEGLQDLLAYFKKRTQ